MLLSVGCEVSLNSGKYRFYSVSFPHVHPAWNVLLAAERDGDLEEILLRNVWAPEGIQL